MLANRGRLGEEGAVLDLLRDREADLSLHDQLWIEYRRALHAGDRSPGRPRGMRMHQEPDLAQLRTEPGYSKLAEPCRVDH